MSPSFVFTLGCLIQGGVLINGGWEPLKETNKRGVFINGGPEIRKNRVLRYLLDTNAFYILRTVYALYAYVEFLRYLLETSAFDMLRTVYAVYALYALSFKQDFI